MIPKIIHFCWFGGSPLPELAQRCIASWRKFLPEYEIWEWTSPPKSPPEGDFESPTPALPRREGEESLYDRELVFDVDIIPYTAEAYRQKKYAFVSDYARFWILYRYGGIYFDTDVEVIRPMDDIIERGNFMGFEVDPDGKNTPGRYAPRYCFDVAPGLGFGMSKEHPFMLKMLDYYADLEFKGAVMNPWFKTIVAYTTEKLMDEGLRNVKGIQQVGDITVYPHDYFAPIDVITGRLHITPNTHTIHRYMGSWSGSPSPALPRREGRSSPTPGPSPVGRGENAIYYLKRKLRDVLPEWVFYLINRIKRRKYRIK